MLRLRRDLVRAFLPLVPLCLWQASGGSDNEVSSAAASAAASAGLGNAVPTIDVAAIGEAKVGTTFEYQPLALDPERDALRFTAVNLPAWATLDAVSGRISGTPGPRDEGVYESISVTVADATHQISSAPFSITVNAAPDDASLALESGTGVASLQWETPPSKVSGEPLDDLVGYRILYGRSSTDLDHSVLITDPATTSYRFSTLTSGVWYFAVVAVNSSGLEGPPTTVATKSI